MATGSLEGLKATHRRIWESFEPTAVEIVRVISKSVNGALGDAPLSDDPGGNSGALWLRSGAFSRPIRRVAPGHSVGQALRSGLSSA